VAKTIRLIGPSQRAYAHTLIDEVPPGYVMKLAKETRSDRQNRALHGWIKTLREALPEFGRYTVEDCKLRLMASLKQEMRFLPELDGQGLFPVGQRTSTLTVEQFSALQTIVIEYAARHGVELPMSEDE
jgi:hypothetical protein